jgi:hypothetical protein
VDGLTWLRRFSSFEAEHNHLAKVRNGWLKALQEIGYSPQFVAAEQIEGGKLPANGRAVLVLPDSFAMSDKEALEIRKFLSNKPGHIVLAEGIPGLFDEHGKLRRQSPLEELVGPASGPPRDGDIRALFGDDRPPAGFTTSAGRYALARLAPLPRLDWPTWLARQLQPMQPEVSLPTEVRARIHRFRLGPIRLVAFERNINYQMSEDLKQAGGNANLESAIATVAMLRQPMHIYDLHTRDYLGYSDKIRFTLAPWEPSLFALTSEKLAQGDVLATLEVDQSH